jgi:hypothetical protein
MSKTKRDWRTEMAEHREKLEKLHDLAVRKGLGHHETYNIQWTWHFNPTVDFCLFGSDFGSDKTELDWFRQMVAEVSEKLETPPFTCKAEHTLSADTANAPDLVAKWKLDKDALGFQAEVRVRVLMPRSCKIKPGTERPEHWTPDYDRYKREAAAAPQLHPECEHAIASLQDELEDKFAE